MILLGAGAYIFGLFPRDFEYICACLTYKQY